MQESRAFYFSHFVFYTVMCFVYMGFEPAAT